MPNIGLPELAIILVIVLLLFGASRLPRLGRSMGQGIKGFKEGLNEPASEAVPEADKPKEIEKDSSADGSTKPTA